jgi:hypothetical protein
MSSAAGHVRLEPFLKQLDADWSTGCHNGAALWRRVKLAGFAAAARVVAEWATRRRKEEATTTGDGRRRAAPRV